MAGEASESPAPAPASSPTGFRRWRRGRPFWAGVWTVLGGAIVAFVPGTSFPLVLIPGGLIWLGILVGVVIVVFGLFFWIQPELRRLLGALTLLLAFASFVTSDFGGLFVGMLFTLIGGSLALSWTPLREKVAD
jgi:hypothetical protein